VTVQSDSTLTANEIDFGAIVGGSATNLVLQPLTLGQSIEIGGADNTTALDLTASELGGLQNFNSITIGRDDGSGNITVNNDLQLNNDLTLNTGSGNITFSGTVDGNYNLRLNAGGDTIFNSRVGGTTPLNILSTNSGGQQPSIAISLPPISWNSTIV
jgi:hypothetical protein